MQIVQLTVDMLKKPVFLQEVAESVQQDFGTIDILVHSLANGPEVFILYSTCFLAFVILS